MIRPSKMSEEILPTILDEKETDLNQLLQARDKEISNLKKLINPSDPDRLQHKERKLEIKSKFEPSQREIGRTAR